MMEQEESQPLLPHRQNHRSPPPRITIHAGMGVAKVVKLVAKNYCVKCCSKETLKQRFPITNWLPKYSLQALQCDLVAGLTVALTVIPQGLAYAKIARLPSQYGLYSAFMGCFVYCFLGTAKDITLGPTAIMSLMTASFAISPVENDATYAIVLCLLCGCVQLLMGILNLGILVNFISYPVINAFTSAAAITIGFGQVKGLLGLTDIPREFLHMVYETFRKIPETKVWDMTMGLVCLVLLFLLKKMRAIQWNDPPDSPPPNLCVQFCRYLIWLTGTAANAIIVISASGVVAILRSQNINDAISITGDIQQGLPSFSAPSFSVQNGNDTISAGTILSGIGAGIGIVPLLGLVELIAIGKAFARQNDYKIYPSQELIAVGTANILSSFISSYPVTGSFSRTAVNSQSGVKTPASGLITGAVILLSLQFLTPLFFYIPKAALSAVIISAVIQMVDYKIVKKLWKANKIDLIPLFVTFLSSLGVGIEYGIIIGVGVDLLTLLYPMARPKINVSDVGVVVLKMDQGVRFPAVDYIQSRVTEAATVKGDKLRSVVVDCTFVTATDYSSMQGFIELIAEFKRKGARIVFACLNAKVLKSLQDKNIPDLLVCSTVDEGCKLLQDELNQEFGDLGKSGETTVVVPVDYPGIRL
ncbi:sodium-independent sulfate anion transporter-like [Mizuhopecten yessoensis]|uniref:sodium-independent sulfate anion transporter-like n=1 Tax=Mizuhopecten yessoensis TaxID=6573 RepID=UPI000B45D580|nr:sodium-independent sulfate anion transporter-like [Mizuhopecten yessoensis]XP_021350032.1 sodium-independent sulfate anion transporter-like [Mizuhopecten yessoensis]